MLTGLFAHTVPRSPGELLSAWTTDPLVWLTGAGVVVLYVRAGHRRRHRPTLFALAMATITIAVVSPLDALGGALASAHMAQHLLLVSVAAPMLALAGAPATLAAGLPPTLARAGRQVRRTLRTRSAIRATKGALVLAGVHTATMWFWHAAGPYDAAVRHDVVHGVEHLTFLVTATAIWASVLGRRGRAEHRVAVSLLALFVLSLQGALLGALLTFAPAPWYSVYRDTTERWGLTQLADQQLAGVLMWVLGGIAYLVAALAIALRWIDSANSNHLAVNEPPQRIPMSLARAKTQSHDP